MKNIVQIKAEGAAPATPRFAPLRNVAQMAVLVERLTSRPHHLPGIGVFYGPSGYGKTYAAIYAQNRHFGAPRVEADEFWTRKKLLKSILLELGIDKVRGTVSELADRVIEIIGVPGHPLLIIDEADILVDKGMIEAVRALHDKSQCPILLIGEEALPDKLQRSERTSNRVLDFQKALPCDLSDARKLAVAHAPRLQFSDGLLNRIVVECEGRARRISTTLEHCVEWARGAGVTSIDEGYSGPVNTGRSPRGRRAA